MSVKPGVMFRAPQAPVVYRERFHPGSANLQFLSCGEYEIAAGAKSQSASYPEEEALLYMWRGKACVALDGASYALASYDMMYVPKGRAVFDFESRRRAGKSDRHAGAGPECAPGASF